MSVIASNYSTYIGTQEGFKKFHNEVINMPRDEFSSIGLEKIRTIASYLLLCKETIGNDSVTYKAIMQTIHEALNSQIYPRIRDLELEKRYFCFNDIKINYNKEGRMFRHLMGICLFFGLLEKETHTTCKIIYNKCKEYYLSEKNILIPVARNNLLNLNAGNNGFLLSLRGPQITNETRYRPALAILRYISEIGREVTSFELSVLLGRVDHIQKEADIIDRALKIGKLLPHCMQQQKSYFFAQMGWRNENNELFSYTPSQQPYFKFNSFLLFMRDFSLIKYNNQTHLYSNTDYANEILADDISYALADLERLLNCIDDEEQNDTELRNIILFQRSPQLLELIKTTEDFYKKMNKRSLRKPLLVNNKRKRNQLIAELAKLRCNYTCQYSGKASFQTPTGKPYCEAHHLIEFGSENGPDITNNLIVLGPEPHKALHFGSTKVIEDIYVKLIKTNAINFEMFKEMVEDYQCLTTSHIDILFNRHLITISQKHELLEMISAQ